MLAACALLGVDEVYAVGGAQAIAMFAWGTEDCPTVDLVTGPGNVYVAAAKRLLKGVVGIDSEAGPTEIGILADDTADPAYVAADLIAQAEHDENASCLLVTDSAELLDAVDVEVAAPGRGHPAPRAGRGRAGRPVRVRRWSTTSTQGIDVVDEWAAEHLEVITADARGDAARDHQRRRDLRRPVRRRSPSATTSPAPTTCCRPAAPRGTAAACRCSRSCAASTSSTTRARRSPTSRRTSTRSAAPRTSPRTSPPCACASRGTA